MYGFWRLVGKHPITRPQYAEWLGNTPWTPKHPLPDGPVQLTWQDGIVVAIFQLLIWLHLEPIPFLGVIVFAYAYLTPCALYLRILKQHKAAYSICFLLLIPLIGGEHSLFLHSFSLLTGLVISQISLPKSLETCIQKMRHGDTPQIIVTNSNIERGPTSRMPMVTPQRFLSRPESVALSLLIGMFSSILFNHPGTADFLQSPTSGMMLIGLPIIVYLGCYLNKHQAPLSITGRIKTGKFIIPKFDSIFIAPLLVLSVTLILLPVLKASTIPPELIIGTTISYTLIILLNVGPTEAEFNLTGAHQIRDIRQIPRRQQTRVR
ncbi:Unannotated [Lentimonas sp. CC19]|nr:Unannotated [Lentimonas sp. CC19]CAA6696387.1 Unannotated [Lentimonas sp. CC10]CAA7069094.1 Unannotated [Lentimonas sp. CC11]